MVVFIIYMDCKTWKTDIKGWTSPKVTYEGGTKSLKLESEWSKEQGE